MGMVSKLNVWVPHELTERNRLERTTACMSLIARNKREPFLKRLCGDTINSDKYCAQLEKLREALAEKRPGLVNRNSVIFHHDNAKPHVAKSVTKKLALQHFLVAKKFENIDTLKNSIENYFKEKQENFYRDGTYQKNGKKYNERGITFFHETE
ncbi:histone-lysine N-methyltransferase SETMAR-like, partial [Bombus bifarius]|uniref:Histone-lysine N-methyltransferase SETMAR-like n=1 Tax=Bombus bifarius TaxID=103933 RepID=A0A6P8N4X4_9HYME